MSGLDQIVRFGLMVAVATTINASNRTFTLVHAYVRTWHNRDPQRGRRQCPLIGGGKPDFNGRYAAQICRCGCGKADNGSRPKAEDAFRDEGDHKADLRVS